MPVTPAVAAGSRSLYGGCATAAALTAAAELCEHTPRWASTHFTGLARLDSAIELHAEVLAAGRSVTHVKVEATNSDGRVCFSTRATFGDRPPVAEPQRPVPPSVAPAEESEPFDHRSHQSTFADRFEWRLAGSAIATSSAWWVRALEPIEDAVLLGAVLCDYVTYGIGRAADQPVGGLSIDNTLRLHDTTAVHGWALVEVEVESIDGAFGSGRARVWRADGTLVCTGSQTMVLNNWDWRQPEE